MKVVFLCGGVGKRMLPLMEDKFLFKFLGKTLLEYHIDMAKKYGDIIIVANDENVDRIEKIAKDAKIVVQKKARGMADALLAAKELINGDEFILVSPNDVFDESAYENLMEAYRSEDAASFITGYVVNDYFPGGYIIRDGKYMKGIVEKPKSPPSNIVNIVLHLHKNTRKLFEYIESTESSSDDVYEKALDRMIKDSEKVFVVDYDGYWQAIKYPWHVLRVLDHFMEKIERKISPSAEISDSAKIYGNVIIEEGVKVLDNAVIRGPAYIGKNSVIGNNVLIWSGTQVGDKCVVGFSTEIKHSYVGDNCWFHENYVGDSIVADDCSFGAGTITANLRFDEKNISSYVKGEKLDTGMNKFGAVFGEKCRTGVHVGIMPGVKVGPNSIVGPHVCLTKDLEPNKIIFENGKIIDNKIKLDERNLSKLVKKLGD